MQNWNPQKQLIELRYGFQKLTIIWLGTNTLTHLWNLCIIMRIIYIKGILNPLGFGFLRPNS